MNIQKHFAPPGTRRKTQKIVCADLFDPEWRASAIRDRLKDILTDKQYRRMVLYHGLEGYQPQSIRQIAEIQDKAPGSIQESLDQARTKIKSDPVLFLLWFFNGVTG